MFSKLLITIKKRKIHYLLVCIVNEELQIVTTTKDFLIVRAHGQTKDASTMF